MKKQILDQEKMIDELKHLALHLNHGDLKIIAEIAGVSPSAISYYINGNPKKIKPAVYDAIKQFSTTRQLQYQNRLNKLNVVQQ